MWAAAPLLPPMPAEGQAPALQKGIHKWHCCYCFCRGGGGSGGGSGGVDKSTPTAAAEGGGDRPDVHDLGQARFAAGPPPCVPRPLPLLRGPLRKGAFSRRHKCTRPPARLGAEQICGWVGARPRALSLVAAGPKRVLGQIERMEKSPFSLRAAGRVRAACIPLARKFESSRARVETQQDAAAQIPGRF